MNQEQTRPWRAEISALFVLAVGLAVPLLAILWGRLGASDTTYFTGRSLSGTQSTVGVRAFDLPSGAGALSALNQEEKSYLMKVVLGSLVADSRDAELVESPPGRCATEAHSPAFVTLYAPGGQRVRAWSRRATPAASVRQAAARLYDHPMFRENRSATVSGLRARIDILTGAVPLSAREKDYFCREAPGQSAGAALAGEKQAYFFLPADVTDHAVAHPAGILRFLQERAATPEEPGGGRDRPVSRIEAVSFVNASPGGSECLDTPRGLVRHVEVTEEQLRRSCRLTAEFLARAQRPDHSFAPICGLFPPRFVGSSNAGRDAAIIYSLAKFYGLTGNQRCRRACSRGLGRLLNLMYRASDESTGLFVWEKVSGRKEAALGTTALALSAFCEFRNNAGEKSYDPFIRLLADFLRFMQEEDGRFRLRYDPDRNRAHSEGCSEARRLLESAQAALGLVLAYREVGEPRFLLAARKALNALCSRDPAAAEAGDAPAPGRAWIMLALREMYPVLSADEYARCASALAAAAGRRRLEPGEAPWPGLAGASAEPYPPMCGPTAQDLQVLAAGRAIERARRGREGSNSSEPPDGTRRTARQILRMQLTPRTGYFLPARSRALGGLLEQPGEPVVTTDCARQALDALMELLDSIESDNRDAE